METRRVKFKSKRAEKNVPFDKRKIKEIVEQIESGIPRREILSEYGMHESTLTNWMTRYGSKDYYAERS
ncbi:hypothetical protein F1649_20325, partial [Arcticibacter tournemirensis]